MIHLEVNAYVILQCENEFVDGRYLEGTCAPEDFYHWHNQPPEADDSPAWRAVRKAIARAMLSNRSAPWIPRD